MESLDLYTAAVIKCFSPPHWNGIRESLVESQKIYYYTEVRNPLQLLSITGSQVESSNEAFVPLPVRAISVEI
jgi:hypothetical protein